MKQSAKQWAVLDRHISTFYNIMMRRSFHHFFSFFLPLFCFAISFSNAQTIVPEIDLKTLYLSVNSSQPPEINQNQTLAIDGTVSAREILQPAEEGFIGLLELTVGEWEGLESVEVYRCYVQLEGDRFADMIPAGRTRETSPIEIPLNTKVLVFGTYIGYSEDAQGNRYPVVLGNAVRIIR